MSEIHSLQGIYPIVVLLFVDYQNNQGGSVFESTKTRQAEATGVRPQSGSRFESLRFASRREGITTDSDAHTGTFENSEVPVPTSAVEQRQ